MIYNFGLAIEITAVSCFFRLTDNGILEKYYLHEYMRVSALDSLIFKLLITKLTQKPLQSYTKERLVCCKFHTGCICS